MTLNQYNATMVSDTSKLAVNNTNTESKKQNVDSSTFQNALDNVDEIKKRGPETWTANTRNTIKGSAGGLIVGLMYAWYTKKNLFAFAIIGSVTGGLLTHFIAPKIKEI